MEQFNKRNLIARYPAMADWIGNLPSEVAARCTVTRYPRGKMLFFRGDEIERVYLICSGTVLISTSDLDGSEKCVVFSGEGEIVGEMEALLHCKSLFYSAKAFTDCVLLEIPLDAFEQWVAIDASLCRNLMYALAGKLLHSSESTVQYQNLTARLRLMNLLAHHEPGIVRETRLALAEACGVSERTIYRAVAEMAARGELSLRRGKIVLTQAQIDRFCQPEFVK